MTYMRFFRSSSNSQATPEQPPVRLTRRSSGLGELAKLMASEDPLCILDLGYTSAANIRYLTERGHKIYSEDLLEASTNPELITKDEQGNKVLDSKKFLDENLNFTNTQFDVVLCWNLADYMDET